MTEPNKWNVCYWEGMGRSPSR